MDLASCSTKPGLGFACASPRLPARVRASRLGWVAYSLEDPTGAGYCRFSSIPMSWSGRITPWFPCGERNSHAPADVGSIPNVSIDDS
jgi:hypothetical protein